MTCRGTARWPVALALLLMLAPLAGNAQSLLDKVKRGVSGAAGTVGEAASGAAGAAAGAASKAGDVIERTIDGTKQSLQDEATPEATRAKLDEMAERTLERLFKERPESRPLFDRSAGYAVFDAREASFYVAAGYGRGVAVDKSTGQRTYMKMATGGAGFGLGFGDFERQLLILIESEAVLRTFLDEGYDASASASMLTGEDREELAAQFTDSRAVFMLTRRGWKVSAKLTGTRYWPDDGLNSYPPDHSGQGASKE